MAVELYFFQPLGTNSGRVFQALLEKGVAFVEHELKGPDFEHLKPAYLRINPKGQVPTLVHDGQVMPEGMIANEYIDEAFEGPPLRPADPRERWRMRVWQRYAENDLGRSLMMINWNRIVPTFVGDRSEAEVLAVLETVPDPDRRRSWLAAYRQITPAEVIEESHRRAREGAKKVEAHLRQHPWVAGSSFSLADIDLNNFCGFMAMWMPELVNQTDTPAFVAWRAKMEARDSTKAMRARSNFNMATRGGAAIANRPAGKAGAH
ncbi:MAG TPA: glutathione S-transferase family protein [Caulobacteraceae bacterium]